MATSLLSQYRLPHWAWFLLVTIVLAVGFVGVSVWLPYHREQQAGQAIKSWGGHIETAPSGPNWLRVLVGDRRMREAAIFDRIVSIRLFDPAIGDVEIENLSRKMRGLTALKELYLNNTSVSDVGVTHLTKLTKLERLALDGTAVTDAGIAPMRVCGRLRFLHLSHTRVSDAGIAHLTGMTNLIWIDLHGTRVTSKGISELQSSSPACTISH